MSLDRYTVQTAAEQLLLAIDCSLIRLVPDWKSAEARTSDGCMPSLPWDWLYLSLEAAADFFDLLRDRRMLTLPNLLNMVLDNIDPQDAQALDAIRRARRRLGTRWSRLLELDCSVVARYLRKTLEKVRQLEPQIEECRGQLALEKATEKQRSTLSEAVDHDGPIPFEFRGRQYHFSRMSSRLLYALRFDEEGRKALKPHYDADIILRLWGERVPSKDETRTSSSKRKKAKQLRNRLYQLELATKAELKQTKDLPIAIERPRNNFLRLIKLQLR